MTLFKSLAILKLACTTLCLLVCIDLLVTRGLYLTGFLVLFVVLVWLNFKLLR